MLKEIRTDICTQAEFAKMNGKSRAWVTQQIAQGKVKTLTVKGAVLIKLS